MPNRNKNVNLVFVLIFQFSILFLSILGLLSCTAVHPSNNISINNQDTNNTPPSLTPTNQNQKYPEIQFITAENISDTDLKNPSKFMHEELQYYMDIVTVEGPNPRMSIILPQGYGTSSKYPNPCQAYYRITEKREFNQLFVTIDQYSPLISQNTNALVPCENKIIDIDQNLLKPDLPSRIFINGKTMQNEKDFKHDPDNIFNKIEVISEVKSEKPSMSVTLSGFYEHPPNRSYQVIQERQDDKIFIVVQAYLMQGVVSFLYPVEFSKRIEVDQNLLQEGLPKEVYVNEVLNPIENK